MDALQESVGPAAVCYPFLIIFFITLLCFNLFIAVISYSFNQIQSDLELSDPKQAEEEQDSGDTNGETEKETDGECTDQAKEGTKENAAESLITESNELHEHLSLQSRLARTSDYHQRLARASEYPLPQLSESTLSKEHPAKQAGNCSAWSSLPGVGKGAGVAIKSAFNSSTRRQIRMQVMNDPLTTLISLTYLWCRACLHCYSRRATTVRRRS